MASGSTTGRRVSTSARTNRRRPSRTTLVRRWLALAALGLVAFLYYRPLVTYLEARERLGRRTSEVAALERQKGDLQRRLAAQTSDAVLVREARRLAFVKPGERLFIVKGIPEWRRARSRASRATIAGGE